MSKTLQGRLQTIMSIKASDSASFGFWDDVVAITAEAIMDEQVALFQSVTRQWNAAASLPDESNSKSSLDQEDDVEQDQTSDNSNKVAPQSTTGQSELDHEDDVEQQTSDNSKKVAPRSTTGQSDVASSWESKNDVLDDDDVSPKECHDHKRAAFPRVKCLGYHPEQQTPANADVEHFNKKLRDRSCANKVWTGSKAVLKAPFTLGLSLSGYLRCKKGSTAPFDATLLHTIVAEVSFLYPELTLAPSENDYLYTWTHAERHEWGQAYATLYENMLADIADKLRLAYPHKIDTRLRRFMYRGGGSWAWLQVLYADTKSWVAFCVTQGELDGNSGRYPLAWCHDFIFPGPVNVNYGQTPEQLHNLADTEELTYSAGRTFLGRDEEGRADTKRWSSGGDYHAFLGMLDYGHFERGSAVFGGATWQAVRENLTVHGAKAPIKDMFCVQAGGTLKRWKHGILEAFRNARKGPSRPTVYLSKEAIRPPADEVAAARNFYREHFCNLLPEPPTETARRREDGTYELMMKDTK